MRKSMSANETTRSHATGSDVQVELERNVYCKDAATDTQNTGPLQISEVLKPAQTDSTDGLQSADVSSLDRTPKTRQTIRGIHDDKTSTVEARKHDDEEISVIDDPGIFQVDLSQIEEVQLSDQAAELQELGLSVYDQDVLEQGIFQQVDEALEQLDQRQLEEQMGAVADEIIICKQQLEKSDTLLRALKVTGTAGQKQAVSVRKSIETRHQQLAALKIRADALQLKYTSLAGLVNEDGSTVCEATDGTSQKESKQQESERERRIRLGEMTPFGSVLGNQVTSTASTNRGLTDFEKYLQSQEELQKRRTKKKLIKKNVVEPEVGGKPNSETNQKKGQRGNSPLKKSILIPKKRPRKEKLGTCSSDDWWDQKKKPGKLLSEQTAYEDSEGSEYLPSGSAEEESEEGGRHVKVTTKKQTVSKRYRRGQCRQKAPEEWATDDSDWDYSDAETRARRRKNSKKEIDDGNTEDYIERLKLWEEQRAGKPETEQTGDHEMEFGYKLPKAVWCKLYNYQKVGVQWLWELNQQRCGGIMGDEMGLGKTVQVIAFLAGLHYSKLLSRHGSFRGLGPSLVICPTTVMHQWVREFHVWWPQFRVAVLHESGSFTGKREALIRQMSSARGILVTSYVGAVQHQEALLARDWHYIILDEGHKIRNPDAQVTLAVKQFRTPHRLILSGSPMQNNLKELWSLFDFIFPGKLGTLPVFLAQLAVPITQGGYANASEVQVATAYKCATVLRDTIAPYLLRRMKTDVKSHIHLPQKNEQVLFCRLSEEQRSLYKSYLDSDEVDRILQGRFRVFVGLIALRKICNHPDLYSGGPKLLRGEREELLPEESRYGYWRRSGKMLVIQSLLSIWQKQGHRVLLFTQSRQMLCILEAFVQKQGYKYLKLDGGTGIASRQPLITKFNEDPSYFVFLLTTRVGGLGINLTGADRVVIYDPDWNPATDTQARERAWRIGQQNHVTVYRLVTAGTIEEKIYHRQIFKQFLCNKVLRDPRQRRFFKSNDLLELFTLSESERTTETAALFAGTGSEVKLRPQASKSHGKLTKPHHKTRHHELKNIKFSASKLERMKRLAQLLSKQIATLNTQGPFTKKRQDMVPERDEMNCKPHSVALASDVTDKNIVQFEGEDVIVEGCDSSERKPVSESETLGKGSCFGQESDVNCDRFMRKDMSGGHESQQRNMKGPLWNGNSAVTNKSEPSKRCQNKEAASSRRHKEKRHSHSSKHSRRKARGAVFEGERVSYLVGQCEAEAANPTDVSEEQTAVQEDDYVLRKLFKKSGLQTAMRHDTIMEGGYADYALVEGEARRVAKEAVQALKESRRQCWQADVGVPSWTGQSGALRSRNMSAAHVGFRFGKKKSGLGSSISTPQSKGKSGTQDGSTDQPMTSSELLSRMRARNRLLEPLVTQEGAPEHNPGNDIPVPSSVPVSEEHVELLADVRNFVSFGASVNGRASTHEILSRFTDRLPPGSSPLFKFMLGEVCEFYRLPSGEGVWRLRNEFRW